MIGGEAATRILHEVMHGILRSKDDTSEEAEYRQQVKVEVDEIHAGGAEVDLPKEWA